MSSTPKKANTTVELVSLALEGEELVVIAISTPTAGFEELTPAENEVCALMLASRSNAQIADARGTSIHTVGNQIAAIFRKLGIKSRAELASLARSRS